MTDRVVITHAWRPLYEAGVVGVGLAAITALAMRVLSFLDDGGGPAEPDRMWGLGWHAGTLALAGVIAVLFALAMIDAGRASDAGRAESAYGGIGTAQRFGLVLGVGAWLLAGLYTLAVWFVLRGVCEDGGRGSFECVHRPGPVLNVLGVTASLAPTLVLWVLFRKGRRSRVAAWLSPVLVIGLYALALLLWEPHIGLGVPLRPEPDF
ncbi:hypothetical protein ABZ801_11735 [Actinomadura sp. NPDC047616]|uniref:hypothetical protein n=1 Tax=Actinomadura sp. NPDC047616 TaxID=3155914 RepID=UPI00340B78F3